MRLGRLAFAALVVAGTAFLCTYPKPREAFDKLGKSLRGFWDQAVNGLKNASENN